MQRLSQMLLAMYTPGHISPCFSMVSQYAGIHNAYSGGVDREPHGIRGLGVQIVFTAMKLASSSTYWLFLLFGPCPMKFDGLILYHLAYAIIMSPEVRLRSVRKE
jgi:hypothetical protein